MTFWNRENVTSNNDVTEYKIMWHRVTPSTVHPAYILSIYPLHSTFGPSPLPIIKVLQHIMREKVKVILMGSILLIYYQKNSHNHMTGWHSHLQHKGPFYSPSLPILHTTTHTSSSPLMTSHTTQISQPLSTSDIMTWTLILNFHGHISHLSLMLHTIHSPYMF